MVRCISGSRGSDSDEEEGTISEHESKNWARTRTLSISSPDDASRAAAAAANASVLKEVTLDYAEISAVPPLPLWLLLAADQGSNLVDSSTSGADTLFHPSLETHVSCCCVYFSLRTKHLIENEPLCQEEEEEDLDDLLSESPPKRKNKRKNTNEASKSQHLQQQYFRFGPRQADLLSSVLTHTQLPGLSSVDQMHLLALADTLASCSATHLVSSSMQSDRKKETKHGKASLSANIIICRVNLQLIASFFFRLPRW